ncbi:MAG TPA: hypothetical protein VLD37_03535 [Candidatus Bilamarchaeum sp.]|nr:hypothetical protein [Candidatus Bilamarchaeum sp.]
MSLRLVVGCALIVFALTFATIVAFGLSQPEMLEIRVEKPEINNTSGLVAEIVQANVTPQIPAVPQEIPAEPVSAATENVTSPPADVKNETVVLPAPEPAPVEVKNDTQPVVTQDTPPVQQETPPPPPPKKRRTRAS